MGRRWNSAAHPGSTYYGRRCLRQVLCEYELWDELIALAEKSDWQTEENASEQTQWLLALGRAHFRKGIDQRDPEQVSAGQTLLARLEKQALAKSGANEAEELGSGIKELKGLNALAAGEAENALTLLKQARGIDPFSLACAHLRAGKQDEAENLVLQQVEQRPDEVLPRAHLVSLRWQIGRKSEAESAFRELRKVAGRADLETPLLARLGPLAEQWGFRRDWRIPPRRFISSKERPSLSSLGPSRWLPRQAPAWSLADAHGRKWSLEGMRGKPVLLIFYQGAGCLHCVEQLQAFAPPRQGLQGGGHHGYRHQHGGRPDAAKSPEELWR